MADQLDPEQITRASDALEQLINGFGKGKTSTEKYADEQVAFGKKLGKTVSDLGSSLYKGEKGVTQFGNAVESVATALASLAAIAATVNPALRVLAMLATGLAVFSKGINAAAKQGDALYKTYQDLGRAGATASDGISGVFRNMQNLGYGIEELDKMVQLVTENSETLAKFSLTAADGTNAFAEGMAQIQRDGGLRLLGKTTDDINSAGAAFIRQQVAAGRTQKDIQGDLGARTKAYILELDRLQRLTGKSADQIQKEQDEAMAEDAYNQVMSELEERAAQGDKSAAAQIQKIKDVMTSVSPELRKELALSLGGDVSAATKLMMSAPSLLRNVMDESKGTVDTLREAGKDLTRTADVFGKGAKVGAYDRETFGVLKDVRIFGKALENIEERDVAAKRNAKVQDTATEAITEAQIANMNSRDAMQAFIQRGVAPATVALAALAKGASALAGGAAGAVGAPTGGAAAGGSGGGGGGGGGAGGLSGYERSIGGPSTLRRFGMAIGAVGAGPGGPGAGLTGKDISGLSPGLARALQQAATEYNQITGKTVEVTSAVRDSAKQAELYQAYVSGNSKFPAAPPGSSKHEKGLAVDISQGVADEMDRMGLLSKYGLSRPVANDPVHLEVSAANGAILSGPMSGYRPNLTMHGTEAIVPLNSSAAQSAFGGSDQTSLMSAQLDKLDELVRVMQNQVSVSTKILQAAN
jgi:hypothetical protein